MQASEMADALPLWALYIITAVVIFFAVEAGWRLGNRKRRRQRAGYEKEVPVGAVVGSMLGLLAFTFGMAATRYDSRKDLVLQEANAIGTT